MAFSYLLFTVVYASAVLHPNQFYANATVALGSNFEMLVIGTAIIVAAHVMSEACRIAEENASIL